MQSVYSTIPADWAPLLSKCKWVCWVWPLWSLVGRIFSFWLLRGRGLSNMSLVLVLCFSTYCCCSILVTFCFWYISLFGVSCLFEEFWYFYLWLIFGMVCLLNQLYHFFWCQCDLESSKAWCLCVVQVIQSVYEVGSLFFFVFSDFSTYCESENIMCWSLSYLAQ